ncbi:MAG: MurR/RpiR family transcriptional regulator, partial [Lachnospiraceae bacterium]
NMREFKQAFRVLEKSTPSSRTSSALKQWQQVSSKLDSMTRQYETHIMRTMEKLDLEDLDRAVREIRKARRVYLFATDAAEGVGAIFSYRCRRLGIEFLPIGTGSSIYESMINLGSRDLILIFSYSRMLSETQILLNHAGKIHCKTILFTDLLAVPELSMADLVLYSYRGEPQEYHSMAAPVALIDLLVMKLMKEMPDSVERAGYLEWLREEYGGIIKR